MRLGLAPLDRSGLLGVAVAQRPQRRRRELPRRFRPALANLLDERGLIERGEGFELLAGRLDAELGAQPAQRVAPRFLVRARDRDQPLDRRLDLGEYSIGGWGDWKLLDEESCRIERLVLHMRQEAP